MTVLHFADISKFQGVPDFSVLDGVIINCAPQNDQYQAQRDKAAQEGKLQADYWWPGAASPDPVADANACADRVDAPGQRRVYLDVEDESLPAMGSDPVSWGVQWFRQMKARGYGVGTYLELRLLSVFGFQPFVDEGADLWVAAWGGGPASVAPWPFATIWQDSNHEPTTGGDDDLVYCDAVAWAKLAGNGGAPAPAPAPAEAPAPAPAPAAPAPQGGPTGWDVDPGDTLSGIASAVGVELGALEAANPWIGNPDQIQVGWHLALPAGAHWPTGAQAQPTSQYQYYTIQPGDTLGAIAAAHGVTVDAILSMNTFITNPDYIQSGWTIRV